MTEKEFWHGDMRLFDAYKIAYIRRTEYLAWKCGNYGEIAFATALNNAFAKKGKEVKYIEFKDPIGEQEQEQTKLTKEELEIEFRNSQARQQGWLHKLLHKG
jgi:hypothetical protein